MSDTVFNFDNLLNVLKEIPQKVYICEDCKEEFHRYHLIANHQQKRKCQYCQQYFNCKSTLKQHLPICLKRTKKEIDDNDIIYNLWGLDTTHH